MTEINKNLRFLRYLQCKHKHRSRILLLSIIHSYVDHVKGKKMAYLTK
jgi:hypothetical protein